MSNDKNCACSTAPKLIFACSGAADVGAVADQAARKLTREGLGKMYCLAGIGGRVSAIMANAQGASKILAIDGCSVDCARKTLEAAGFNDFAHLSLGKEGFEKGASPANEENIAKAAGLARPLLEA